MKDFKSILLALLSIGLIGTWFFHFYDKSHYTNDKERTYIKDSAAIAQIIAEAVKNSVQKVNIPDTVSENNNDHYIDSLRSLLDSSVSEVMTLKKEIDGILKNDQATQSDLTRSRQLINELNKKADQLNAENKLLQAQKLRLGANRQNSNTIQTGSLQSLSPKKYSKKDSLFVASDLNLSAVMTEDDKESAATTTGEADKIVFSFTLQNDILKDAYYDVYIVITGPGKKILQADEWAAAENFFVSKTEGTRAFTKKIRFEFNQGDPKKIIASVIPDKISKGQYVLKVYYDGVVIGQVRKSIG